MQRTSIFAVILLCCVQIGFGGYSVILAVYGKGHIDPVVFSLFRDSCAFPILLTAAAIVEGIRVPKCKDLPLYLGMGLVGIFGNQVLFILGLYNAGADIASIFQPSVPVLTCLFALLTRQEPLPLLCGKGYCKRHDGKVDGRTAITGWLKIGGILLVCVGGCIMVLSAPSKNASRAKAVLLGELMLLGNCSCMAVYVLIQKRWIFNDESPQSWREKPINVTAWSYMFGALFMAVASAVVAAKNPSVFDLFPKSLPPCQPTKTSMLAAVSNITKSWCDLHSGKLFNSTVQSLCSCDTVDYGSFLIPLCYAAFVSSSMAYGFITIANKFLPSSMVTAFWPMQVPAAVFLNYLVNAKTVTLGQILGGLVIILALFMVCISDGIEKKNQENAPLEINETTRLVSKSSDYET